MGPGRQRLGAGAWAENWGARLGRRLAGRAGKRERRVSGRAGKKAMRAENEEGEEKMILFFFFFYTFPNPFLNSNFNSF